MTSDDGPLRAARSNLGWSQSEAAAALTELAARRGVAVAAPASLKTQLSRWENRHITPDESYRVLLCELYGRDGHELGLLAAGPGAPGPGDGTGPRDAPDGRDEAALLRTELAVATAVDDDAVDLLQTQLEATIALDRRLGTVAVSGSVRAQLSHLERVLAHAVSPPIGRRLARLVASASLQAGRVADDECGGAAAWRHFERAKQAGQAIGAPVLSACALIGQAQVLAGIGQEPVAVQLLEQAQTLAASESSPALQAWVAAHLGDVLAAAGSDHAARAAYDDARQRLSGAPLEVELSYPRDVVVEFGAGHEFDDTALLRHRGHGLHLLHDDGQAIVHLEQALRSATSPAREVTQAHVDLALAFHATDDQAAADRYARTAREFAARIGSNRLTARLDAGLRA